MIKQKNIICLRCGEKFVKLDTHIKKKYICDANCLDITYEDMIKEYDKYYIDYIKIVYKNINKIMDY